MSFRAQLLLLTTWLAACAGACSPVQQFYMKEKIIEGAPRHGIVTNNFLNGRAMGPADSLFVVDNTETGEAAGEAFQRAYSDFIGRFNLPEARLLDLRAQVVTTPKSQTPGNWVATGASPAAQLAELFTSPDRILNYAVTGNLNPLTATGSGLAHKAFENHGGAPLFLFFLMGADLDPDQDPATDAKYFVEQISKGRGFHQTHLVLLTRVTSPSAHASPFPRCGTSFFPAPRAVATFNAMPWRSLTQVDLCHPKWADTFPAAAFTALLDHKKRFVLSHVPYQPSTMLLRSANRLFRYGDDYALDARTNEITFLRDPGLLDGDPLEARYYLPPTEEVLNNSPSPPIEGSRS